MYLPLAVYEFLEIGTEQTVPWSTQPSILRGIEKLVPAFGLSNSLLRTMLDVDKAVYRRTHGLSI